MKTFIRRLSSRGEDAAPSLASTTSASSLAESQRNPPHGGGASGSRVSLGMAPKAVDFSAAWSRIHATLDGLTSGEGLPAAEASWLALYTDVYRICTSPPVGGLGGPPAAAGAGIAGSGGGVHRRLYDHLHDFLHQHCDAVVVRLLTAAESHTAFQFLTLYADFYTLYTKGMETGGKLLAYLDRFWITKHHHKKGIDPSQGVMFIAELVPLVWRQSPPPPPPEHLDVLRRVIGSFVALGTTLEPSHPVGFYKEQLEDHVLREVYLHYVYKAGLFAAEVSAGHADEAAVAKYIRTVEGCVAAEKAIWEPVYPSTSRGAVRVVRKSMLESQPHHQILMAFANAALAFHAERLADLELLYRLLDNEDVEPTKGIEALRNVFFGFVKEVGAREVKRANEEARHRQSSPLRPDMSHMLARSSLPPDYVCSDTIQTMLDIYSHYLTLVRVTFKDDSRFAKAFKTACEHFINALPNMSESLAIHSHYFLDKNCPESRMENVDVALDSIVLLFNFIQDKDLFHRSYARLLAARIISFSSVSDEAERRMMKHLMQVCGFQYAMTFQRMFMDKTLSFELSREFAEWEREHRAQQQRLLLMRQKQLAEGRGVCLEDGDEVGEADGVTGMEDGGRGGAGGAGGAVGEVGRGGHGRRKSDSAIEFVETESGHVTPRSVSPKLSHGMRFIGLHDSSPLQVLLSKRVFADKVKKYKERGLVSTPASSALVQKGDLPHPSSASPQAAAQGGGGTTGTHSVMSGRTPSYHRGNTFFFGDDDINSPGTAGAGGGGGGSGGAGFSWSHSVLDAPYAKKGTRQTSGAGGQAEVEFFVFILTGGSWPYPSTGQLVQLPAPLMRCIESFSTFYDAKYKRRRLTWLHELGHGEVLFRCPASDRSYTLLVSTSQICILLLFNSRPAWSVEELQRALDLDLGELVLCLYPLLRSQVLTCTSEVAVASKLTKHHTVVVNEGLSRRGCRLAVPRKCDEAELPSALDSPRSMDPARISPTLLNERKSAIEARVVHLMKKAGSMRHDKLIEAVLQHTRQMNFLPPVDFICEIIRADIDKDFLELAEDGPNPLYRYLA
ncbi:hypothetical protein NSK_003784 [Nannochloropsis salina CCMP1776]|uniref:Cullin family profile domain-containing protein n=1 Tax=Nannochloropsis salina CCMP1776 TaxID=1027361 RepID=A0A4D9CZD0_9STRA|nr:hypothetical protein NSK_003784 [Nannochloropsis salina CCMP1776]|eukprot:TFJ84752.1 hypothetical protein NSK_003784 [Nannochloropsis salina CCMP1776]